MKSGAPLFCILLLLGIQISGSAFGQSRYVCRQSNGSTTISDRPCNDSGAPVVAYGPTQQQPTFSNIPKSPDAPEHLKYLGSRCASMNDAIRTGPSRGLTYQTQAELQRSYRRDCAEEESQAYRQLSEDRRSSQTAKQESQRQANAEKQQSALKQQQCDESKRIIHTKSARTDLNDGERAELARFKENYQARCL
ncbi:MAG: hypothetical protein H7Y28_09235 [Rhodoferax sp.]|nr:hypothetical protein [Rhodoferax sp.]